MLSNRFISAVVMPAILLAGCTTTPGYQTHAANKSEAAAVRRVTFRGFADQTIVELEKVDGLPCPMLSDPVLIDPGSRILNVVGNYHGVFGVQERGRVELNATVRAGHTYRIRVERNGRIMTFWVEDEEAHEAVSEKRSTTTTHWIKWL
jgi:hypothetical protein